MYIFSNNYKFNTFFKNMFLKINTKGIIRQFCKHPTKYLKICVKYKWKLIKNNIFYYKMCRIVFKTTLK